MSHYIADNVEIKLTRDKLPMVDCKRIKCFYCKEDNKCLRSEHTKSPRPTGDNNCPLFRQQQFDIEKKILDYILKEYPKAFKKYDFDAEYYLYTKIYDLILEWIENNPDYIYVDDLVDACKDIDRW